MKKNKNIIDPVENFKINEQKLYQRKIKRVQVEKQTLLKESKKHPKEEK